MPFDPYQFRQARSAFEIDFDLENACTALANFIRANPDAPKAPLGVAARQLLRAARQTSILAYAFVGGIGGGVDEDEPPPHPPIKPIQINRMAQLQEAMKYRDGLLNEGLETARRALEDAGIIDADLYMRDARARLTVLDLNLPHSDPPMQPAGQSGRRTCWKPHGDYNMSQKYGHWCSHYMREWCLEWCNLWDKVSPDRALMADCLSYYAHIVKMQHQAGALVAGISTYWRWDTMDEFDKLSQAITLISREHGGEGTPAAYFAMWSVWAELSSKQEAYRAGTKRLADSETKTAAWIDWLMIFPNGRSSRT